MKSLYQKVIFLIFLLVFFANISYTQVRLILKDKASSLPVAGASYISGSQEYLSDYNGYIELKDQLSLK